APRPPPDPQPESKEPHMTPRMSPRRTTLVSGLLLAAVSATAGAVVAQPWTAVAQHRDASEASAPTEPGTVPPQDPLSPAPGSVIEPVSAGIGARDPAASDAVR